MRPPDPHSRALGILKYAKSFLPLESMKKYRICGSTVEPHFRYCCSVWGCCRSTGINHLQKLYKGAARIVTSSSIDAPSRPRIKELGWKTSDELVSNESKVMVCKSQHQLASKYLCIMFIKNSNLCSRNFRNTETDFRLPIKKSANGQKSFSFTGAKLWNSLSVGTKQAATLDELKKSLVPL